LLPDILDGKVEPGRVFDRTISLDQVPDGYRAMADREALKVLIQPRPPTAEFACVRRGESYQSAGSPETTDISVAHPCAAGWCAIGSRRRR
jgi:hypothetical protein